ncbi:MAG: tRNA threonylcarbamoyladenosine biosynthesis protein TsaB [Thiomicrorhabdus sp.]|nr:MAG: tRNA threonylcarbamoyladenosine biosynthesis protein TsaB [Thiomicrorhabdus sp.]
MTQTKSILAIETSTAACSVALLYQGNTYERYEVLPQKHAHRLLEMVDEVMTEAQADDQALDLLAFGEGPGAFTGVRISAGVIQGLALGWDKPVVGISSLEAMAELAVQKAVASQDMGGLGLAQEKLSWCTLMDARMNEVYFLSGIYSPKSGAWQLSETELLSPELAEERIKGLGVTIGFGDIQKEYPPLLKLFDHWIEVLPAALSIAKIAERSLEQAEKQAYKLEKQVALPVYLRNHVADTIEERKLKQSSS